MKVLLTVLHTIVAAYSASTCQYITFSSTNNVACRFALLTLVTPIVSTLSIAIVMANVIEISITLKFTMLR